MSKARRCTDHASVGMVFTLIQLKDGLPAGLGCKLLNEGRIGRTVYRDVGWMWRERSDNQHFVSRFGDYTDRRYLPADTEVILVPIPADPDCA